MGREVQEGGYLEPSWCGGDRLALGAGEGAHPCSAGCSCGVPASLLCPLGSWSCRRGTTISDE